ncbi:NAD-dependent epimerase/dehydratase family protein [bacterium SCSIO 12741]|nr:NAD-dependent epimerase/dehydratase family protein [bacterium SCSIO 12741]
MKLENHNKRTILITGATGFLGSRIVEYFAGSGEFDHLIATGRKFSSNNRVDHSKVKYVLGDLSDRSFVESLFLQNISVVVNCASLSSPWGEEEAFYSANVKTQEHLIAMSEVADVERFVYISTPGIYFNFQDAMGLVEDSPLPQKMVNAYAETKWKAECLLRKSNLPFVILRPRGLIGRGDTVIMPRLVRACEEKRLKMVGDGRNVVDLTSVLNMVQAVELAIKTPHVNESYNISNGEPVNLWDSIFSVLEAIGIPKPTKRIPYKALLWIAGLLEFKARVWGGREPVLTKYSVGVLATSFVFDIRKAREKLGYRPTQTTAEAMNEFVQWYLAKQHGRSKV